MSDVSSFYAFGSMSDTERLSAKKKPIKTSASRRPTSAMPESSTASPALFPVYLNIMKRSKSMSESPLDSPAPASHKCKPLVSSEFGSHVSALFRSSST